MRRRLTLVAFAAVSACTVLVGCSGSSSGGATGGVSGTNNSTAAPKTELTDAVHALSAGSSLTTTLGLDTTSSNLIHITGENGGTPITQRQADMLSSASIAIAVQAPSGKTLAQASSADAASGTSVQITGAAGGATYFTFTIVNKNLYGQVDLKGLLDGIGKADSYRAITAQTATAPPFVHDFLAGKAVEVPGSVISSLTALIQGATSGQGGSNPVPNAAQVAGLVTALRDAFLNDVTVTRTSTGTTDQLGLTGNVRTIAHDVLSAVATAIPLAAPQIDPSQADQAPDRTVKATASVTGGALSKLTFDVGQFSPHQAATLPVVAAFSRTTPAIKAPGGATVVSFQDLVSLVTGFAGSTG